MLGRKNPSYVRSAAVFIGWLKPRLGEPVPLYNITVKNHPSFGSTVSDRTLRKLGLQIPRTPLPDRANMTESVYARRSGEYHTRIEAPAEKTSSYHQPKSK